MEALIKLEKLSMEFTENNGEKTIAVDDVTFEIFNGETFGLAGPSPSGKSTIGRLILGLIKPTSGRIIFEGKDVSQQDENQMLLLRRKMQMVFQNPLSSLNPRKTIGNSLELPLINFKLGSSEERKHRIADLLRTVGLEPKHAERYPHEFSGGQAQRIGIAWALAANAKFIFLDEPVSALDVSIQAQILNLLKELQDEFQLTYLFVANNLNVVQYFSDRVAIIKEGRILELSPTDVLFKNPRDPYTKKLLSAVLSLHKTK